jgi:hypothetical protein
VAAVSATPRPPDCISLEAHRDDDHLVERWVRWAFVATLLAIAIAALAGVFGQRPTTDDVVGRGATLTVQSPPALRGGLLFQGRFEIVAEQALRRPTLVLDEGWFDGLTLNTVQPEPTETRSENRGVAMEFGPLAAGRTLTAYLEFQVNPTTVGRRSQDVALRDGDRPIALLEKTVAIFP